MPGTAEKRLSASEALFGENPTNSSRSARGVLRFADKVRVRKEQEAIDRSITQVFSSLTGHMKAVGERSSFTLHWGGNKEAPRTIVVEYAELEDNSAVLGISGSMDGEDVAGKTVMVLDSAGRLGIDNTDSGRVVPLVDMPTIEKAEIAPVITAINRGVEQGRTEIVAGSAPAADHQHPVAA